MKGTYLGEFQEIVLLAILILKDEAYGVSIQTEIMNELDRNISRGALHTALTRLQDKGFIKSEVGGATKERGGRRKRLYTVTNLGRAALNEARDIRDQMWKKVPDLALNFNYSI
ncbi:MAG TPA: helix-turn-helix transcriptional regulator [Fulvivirga sp.]|nr:helix-turn-helix transcriptional regulator [Fulvivirga sp.]